VTPFVLVRSEVPETPCMWVGVGPLSWCTTSFLARFGLVMKRYSHIRRQELNRAAAALEPKFLKNGLVITPEDAIGATID